jgi:signal transduction histidine kinase/CheY-like chemotaxis protein
MSLGKKIAVLFLVLGIGFSFGSYAALRLTVFPAFDEFEHSTADQDRARIAEALEGNMRALAIMNMEYSLWDQTYAYAMGERPEYPDENLDPAYWHSVDTHMMLIYDAEGRLLSGYLGDPETGAELDPDEILVDRLTPDHPFVRHDHLDSSARGLLETRAGILRAVSYPILTSEGMGPIAGSLVVGQFLTDSDIEAIARQSSTRLELHSTDMSEAPPRVTAAISKMAAAGQTIYVDHADDAIHSYEILSDVRGRAIGVLETYTPREISRMGAATIRAAALFLCAASAVFLLAALYFLQRHIVGPVKRLTAKIQTIRETGDLAVDFGDPGKDEVGALAREFGELAGRLTRAQAALEAARDEALELANAKSEFLARMSHEIRTPMNGVLGMTELLRNTPLKAKQQRFVETIYESAESLLRIINDILDFSKIEAGKLTLEDVETDLRNIVEETVESLADQAHQKQLELNAVVPPDMQTCVHTDPLRLRQVLTNLIGNAIKFTDDGEIVVRLEERHAEGGRTEVRFSVEDTGIGISKKNQLSIFDSFMQEDGTTTRRYGGTGLGLAISSQIVDLMGGQLRVESEPGMGSTFSFTLGFETAASVPAAGASTPSGVAGKKVLIVDDNATNREILENQLQSWHAKTCSACNAEQALKILGKERYGGAPFDLVILDMHMPRTDGLQLARAIRAEPRLAEVKMIILSSVAMPASGRTVRELGIAGQLTKPVRQSQLYDALLSTFSGEAVVEGYGHRNSSLARSLSGKVLLAEDNPVNQAVATGMLEELGLAVEIAVNGKEAMHKATRGTYDVVLMDCQMPVLDGFEATERIRRIEKEAGRDPVPIRSVPHPKWQEIWPKVARSSSENM